MGIAGPLLAPHTSPFPLLALSPSGTPGASIMGLYSPYLGDLNGFSSLNPSSSLMAFCSEVLTLFTADPLRPAMGNVPFYREIRSHMRRICTLNYVLPAFLFSVFALFPFPLTLFSKSLSCTISQTHLHIHFHSWANSNSFNHILRLTLKAYLSHV